MDYSTEVWHTQTLPQEEEEELERGGMAPKLLKCTHVFCQSTLMDLKQVNIPCPLCCHLTPIPESGLLALPTSFQLDQVWLEGQQLCYQCSVGTSGGVLCVCVDIGTSMPTVQSPRPPLPASHRHLCGPLVQMALWKRLLLVALLAMVLVCVVLWQLRCTFRMPSLTCLAPEQLLTVTYPLLVM
uniref:RING-type domain-containing protein n=1 Tax=Scleropages formosus TaxID=113540 RepID=A0A8C9RCT4_SCLFO